MFLLFCALPFALFVLVIAYFPFQCIRRGSRVHTPKGLIPIENLRVGDAIWCCSPDLEIVPGSITDVISGREQPCSKITLEDGSVLFATAQHPVCTQAGWIKVGELKVGMKIRTLNAFSALIALEENAASDAVYDLSVTPYPNFFAESVLVHNKMRKK